MKTTIDPKALYWASFDRFELRIPGQAVLDCSRSGACDEDVAYWAPRIADQVERDNFKLRPTPDKIRAVLSEYGAWDETELADDSANWNRIVWLACGNISDSDAPDCSEPVK